MLIGLLIALVGALVGAVGSIAVPWVDEDVVRFADPALFQGFQWWTGAIAIALVFVAMLVIVAGFFVHRRKPFALAALVLAALALPFIFLTPFTIWSAISAMIEAQALAAGTEIAMFYGFHLLFLGTVIMIVGLIWTLAAQPMLGPEDRLLRVALLWDGKLIKETTFTERRDITIGEAVHCDFVVPAPEVGKSLSAFKVDRKGNYSVALNRDMKGRVSLDGTLGSIREFVKRQTSDTAGINYVPIKKGDWGVFEFNNKIELFFQFVRPGVIIGRSTAAQMDGSFVAGTIGAGFVMLSVMVMAQFIWDPAGELVQHRAERRVMKVETNIKVDDQDQDVLELTEMEDDSVGKKAEGEEGKFGDPDTDPTLESKVPKRDGALANQIDVKKIGLANVLSNQLAKSGAISSILSDDADAFDNRMAVAMAGTGSEMAIGYGAGGMGFRGTGAGGGGTGGYGRIHGLGRVDTGGGMGMRAGLGKKKAKKVGVMKMDGMGATGFCKKDHIRTVVLQRAGAIRACYERQLMIHENLSGKLSIRWTINMEGRVDAASVTESTVRNSEVENCVMRVVRNMRFEKPEGGICVVQWPFVFSPG